MRHWFKKTHTLIILLVGFVLMLFLTVFLFTSYTIQQKQTNLLLSERNHIRASVEHHFHTIELTLDAVADYIEVHNPSDADLLNYMRALENRDDRVYTMYLGKPDKTMVNTSGFEPPEGFDLTTRLWYTMAVEAATAIYTPAFLNATEDRIILTIARPVYNGDTLLGVLATDMDISTITDFVSNQYVGESGYAYLFDQNDTLLAHPAIDHEALILHDAKALTPALLAFIDDDFASNIDVNETSGAVASSAVAGGVYTVGVFMPSSEFNETSTIFLYVSLMAIALLIAVSGSLMVYNIRKVERPTQQLLSDIVALGEDPNQSKVLAIDASDSFGDVKRALNAILLAKEHAFNQYRESQRTLKRTSEQVVRMMESTTDIVFEIDVNSRFTTMYGKTLSRLNIDANMFIGKTVLEAFGDSANTRAALYKRALNGETVRYEWTYEKDGKTLHFASVLSPIYDQKKTIVGAVGIARDMSEHVEKQSEIEYMSTHDFLTELHNRRYFSDQLSTLDRIESLPLGIVMIDLNGLKILNDAFGHAVGDQALIALANILRSQCHGNVTAARIGGDEFAMIFPSHSRLAMQSICKAIKEAADATIIKSVSLSIAIGFAIKETVDTSIADTMKTAENYMYQYKLSEGRDARTKMVDDIMETFFAMHPRERAHAERVNELALIVGKSMRMGDDELNRLSIAATYHDIGKIMIDGALLNKEGPLSGEEHKILQNHTVNGYQILRATDRYVAIAEHALSHHEYFNGEGYPNALKGEDIPLFSRIIAVCEAYATMTMEQPYQQKRTPDEALAIIKNRRQSQFDPVIIDVFKRVV